MPAALRNLDDRVIGSRKEPADHSGEDPHDDRREGEGHHVTRTERRPARGTGGGDGLASFLAVVWRVSKLVLLALALVLLVAIAFTLLPANEDNVIVRNALSLAETVAGPFADVFTVDDPERQRIYNYGLAAVVYFIAAQVVGKLPTGRAKTA